MLSLVRLSVFRAALWGIALAGLGGAVQPAAAQFYAPFGFYERRRTPTVSPADVYFIVRRDGYRRIGRPSFRGDFYVVDATNDDDERVRLLVDGFYGRIIEGRLLGPDADAAQPPRTRQANRQTGEPDLTVPPPLGGATAPPRRAKRITTTAPKAAPRPPAAAQPATASAPPLTTTPITATPMTPTPTAPTLVTPPPTQSSKEAPPGPPAPVTNTPAAVPNTPAAAVPDAPPAASTKPVTPPVASAAPTALPAPAALPPLSPPPSPRKAEPAKAPAKPAATAAATRAKPPVAPPAAAPPADKAKLGSGTQTSPRRIDLTPTPQDDVSKARPPSPGTPPAQAPINAVPVAPLD